jgi:tetratricopeptide (TPR) repeat protein
MNDTYYTGEMDDSEPEYGNLYNKLEKLLETKQWDILVSYAKTLIQRFPNDIYILKRLGIALVKQKKFNEAIIYYEKAVEAGKTLGAGHMEYVKQLDVLYRRQERYDDAFRICSYYLSQNKNSDDAINRFNRSAKLTGQSELVKEGNLIVEPTNNRVPLGKPLPAVKKIAAPTQQELDHLCAEWDELVPEEWRGLLDAKPLGYTGTPAPRFYYDEVRRINIRASNGQVVTYQEKRLAYLAFKKAKDSKK